MHAVLNYISLSISTALTEVGREVARVEHDVGLPRGGAREVVVVVVLRVHEQDLHVAPGARPRAAAR